MKIIDNNMERTPMKWKPIPDTDRLYWVNNYGRVESRRYGKKRILKGGKVYKDYKTRYYLRVTITDKEGNRVRYLIHRLVLSLFKGNPENLPQVNHKDGDRTNNRIDNLEWCTQSYNTKHSIHVLGNVPVGNNKAKGDKNPGAKLSWDQVDEIRKQNQLKRKNQSQLAKEYGITRIGINKIVNNKSWIR